MTWNWLFIGTALLGFGLTGCTDGNKSAAPIVSTASYDTYLPLKLGGVEIQAQFAITPSEMQRGLMHRTELGENQGMLFVYTEPQQLGFWMRNTLIPLDLGFFSPEGVLLEIHPMYPKDETAVRSSSSNVLLALEMNQGWFRKNGLKPGAVLDMSQVRTGLQARGVDPERIAPKKK